MNHTPESGSHEDVEPPSRATNQGFIDRLPIEEVELRLSAMGDELKLMRRELGEEPKDYLEDLEHLDSTGKRGRLDNLAAEMQQLENRLDN